MAMSSKAVFLDKDGTLIEDVPYNTDTSRIRLMPGAREGLIMLDEAGYDLFVITNQSGVARGYFPESDIAGVEQYIRRLFGDMDLSMKGFFYCPHNPDGCIPEYAVACACRKPEPGMLLAAADAHGIDLPASWLIGDIVDDIAAGNRAGCRCVLIDNGVDSYDWPSLPPVCHPFSICRNLREAAEVIVAAGDPMAAESAGKLGERHA
jgi:D-glycero-D-manno-heptose 1,7-bisphosphate phosphatase